MINWKVNGDINKQQGRANYGSALFIYTTHLLRKEFAMKHNGRSISIVLGLIMLCTTCVAAQDWPDRFPRRPP